MTKEEEVKLNEQVEAIKAKLDKQGNKSSFGGLSVEKLEEVIRDSWAKVEQDKSDRPRVIMELKQLVEFHEEYGREGLMRMVRDVDIVTAKEGRDFLEMNLYGGK